jgi:hypothetical protein
LIGAFASRQLRKSHAPDVGVKWKNAFPLKGFRALKRVRFFPLSDGACLTEAASQWREALFTLPVPMPLKPMALPRRIRHCRRSFTPQQSIGPYKLPHTLSDRLAGMLTGFRNAESAFALATFLSRYWSAPSRLERSFPVDRRALADHRELGLTESQVRGAIRTLEAVGFLDRVIPESGSRYRPTEAGLQRKPVLFRFGTEFLAAFTVANRQAKAKLLSKRVDTRSNSTALKSPKSKESNGTVVLMGKVRKGLPERAVSEPNPRLEAALERWKQAFEHHRKQ